jgi:hypothetical protein
MNQCFGEFGGETSRRLSAIVGTRTSRNCAARGNSPRRNGSACSKDDSLVDLSAPDAATKTAQY